MLVYIGIIIVLILIWIHHWVMSPYEYWKKRNVPYPKPIPFVGNILNTILMKKMYGENLRDIYRQYEHYRYIGVFKGRQPCLFIRDPELIREVLVTNFNSFHDNESYVDINQEPIEGRNPFFLRGHKWKIVRNQVSSAITTSKIKNMVSLIASVGKNMSQYLKLNCDVSNKEGLEVKELAAMFTTDVVALCAFGLDGKSFIEPDAEFRAMGKKFLSPSGWKAIMQTLIFHAIFPSLAGILKLRFIPKEVEYWFSAILTETIKYRKENNIVRNDYLDIMISLKDKPGEYEFKDIDVIAQAMTFYEDGFETSSTAISFILYEIAENPDIQQKLKDEIDEILAKHNGEITFESIQDMSYLDKIVNEGLRKYPPGVSFNKMCTKEIMLPPPKPGGKTLNVEKGLTVLIPVLALHYDPQYYPDPEKFDPERFSEEAKTTRPKQVYLPFGDGPRQCLGLRFALIQIKISIVSIVKDFEIKVNTKTMRPLEWDPTYHILLAKGGLWLNFYKR